MPPKGKIFAFFGLIASGKSTLAEAWAQRCGAKYYNSDIVRKELAGLRAQEGQQVSFAEGIYTPEFSRLTYDALLGFAREELAAGRSVVLDASYQGEDERRLLKEVAGTFGQGIIFIQCLCPEDEMKKRMEIRAGDPNAVSDGRWEIYLLQKEKFSQPKELNESELIAINTDMPVADLVGELARMLEGIEKGEVYV